MNQKLYWLLPHEARRRAFKRERPKRYARSQRMRRKLPKNRHVPSLVPFLEHECIFLHIPKTAGVSMQESLFGRSTAGHMDFREMQSAFDRNEWRRFYKFAFVRNPYDRLVSAFKFLQFGGMNDRDKIWAQQNIDGFETFAQFVHEWVTEDNVAAARFHFHPQAQWLGPPSAVKPQIDFVGRFENIEEDYEQLRRHLGFGRELPYLNKTKTLEKDFRSYYDDEAIEIVSRVYRRDLDMLGYTFDA